MAERLEIIITEKGAVVARKNIESVGRAAVTSGGGVDILRRALGLLGGIAAVTQVVRYADTFTQLQNQIRVASGDTADLTATTERLFDISNRTRTSIEANVQLYQRLSFAAGELGASQEELFQFVETTGKALAIQGGSASAASGALLQLSQAVGSGIVRAEEFNSILEGAFPIALAVAKGLDAAGGSVARLRSLIIKGKVTSDEFFRALLSQSDELEASFARTTPTISQAFTVLQNNAIKFFGELDKSAGVTALLSQGLIVLANNLHLVGSALLVVAAGMAVAFAPRAIAAVAAMGRAMLALVVALGPIGIAAVAFTALVVATQELTGALFESEGVAVTLGDTVTAVFNVLSSLATQASAVVSSVLGGAFAGVSIQVGGLRGVLATTFNLLVRGIDGVLGLILGLGRAIGVGIRGAFEDFPSFVQAIFITAFNNALTVAEASINFLVGMLNRLPGVNIGEVAFEEFKIRGESAAVDLSERINEAFRSGFDARPLQDLVDLFGAEAVAVAKLRVETERQKKALQGSAEVKKKDFQLTDEQAKAFERLRAQLDPMGELLRDNAEAQDLLNKARRAGLVGDEEYVKLQMELARQFESNKLEERIRQLDQMTDATSGFSRGMLRIQQDIADTATEAEDLLTNAFQGGKEALVDLITTGKADFKSLVQSIAADLARLGINQLLQGAVGAVGALGGAKPGASGGGVDVAGLVGGLFSSFLGGFASGGSFDVGPGTSPTLGGQDNRLVAFRARDGENVTVTPRGQTPGGVNVSLTQNIMTRDRNSAKHSDTQNLNRASAQLSRAARRR